MPRQYARAPKQTTVAGRETRLSVRVGSDVDRLIAEAVAVASGGETPLIDCVLSINSVYDSGTEQLTVTVTDSTGAPVEDATVEVS
jgi:hypothetical protein